MNPREAAALAALDARAAQAAADLRAAAKLLVEKGWARGALCRDAAGEKLDIHDDAERAACFCVEGALKVATGENEWTASPRAFRRYEHALISLRGQVGQEAVYAWNDAPGRTVEEVIAALLAAADAEERAQ